MVALLTLATGLATVGTTVPLGSAMGALCRNTLRAAFFNKSAFNAEVAVQVLLPRVLEIGGEGIERNSSVPRRGHTLFVSAPGDEVLAIQTALVSHVVAVVAKACTRLLVCVLVASFFSALANASIHVEVVTHALGALILRIASGAARNSLATRNTNSLIQIVAIFALHAPVLIALTSFAVFDKPAFLALAVADKVVLTALLAAASRAILALPSKPLLATDALAVQTKVAFLALLALQAIVALLAIDVHELGALLASAILDEGSLDTALVCKREEAK